MTATEHTDLMRFLQATVLAPVRSHPLAEAELLKYHWELYRNIEELSLVKSSAAILTLILFKLARLTNEMTQESKNNRKVVRAEKAEKSTGDNNLKSTIENINEKTRIDFSRTAEIDLAVANGVYNKNESNSDDMIYAEK